MSRKFVALLSIILIALSTSAQEYNMYVDSNGVMRRNDTKAEVSYFGVNYTLPFAHAYRAINYVKKNHKEAISRDVYHFARLGFNAFRVHIWDVEISDANGTLIENNHLDLLDFLIAECEKRGISVMLTAQTNFGNGYPERNDSTEGFSTLYSKCEIHNNPSAIKAQERYAKALASHLNPYTGKSYASDNKIVIMEINNEPCHSNTPDEVTAYINRMVKAFRSGGWEKPLFYNVSHNMYAIEAYYKANVQGTTYQWYPIGLVSGSTRKGNFLPTVDSYKIPFDKVKNFNKMAKAVYEYDPADILSSYIHPAMARTFRGVGFQWITQFAYDPIDIAKWNTEYQTHYLNLAYTPNKAISMKIAAEVAREVKRGETFGKYPQDTIFGSTTVSYKRDLSEFNDGVKFFYSNNTHTYPKNSNTLTHVAGVGTSPIVEYSGNGAYFIDKISTNTWRLEVMPDIALVNDPFAKPSLSREVGKIFYRHQQMRIVLDELGANYAFKAINEGNNYHGSATQGEFSVYPGVYLLSANQENINKLSPNSLYGVIKLNEYVAPQADNNATAILHTPAVELEKGMNLEVCAKTFGSTLPDSVIIYPDNVSFWNEHNITYKMRNIKGNEYVATISADKLNSSFNYNIVIFTNGKSVTFPQNENGTPLSWDFKNSNYYSTMVKSANDPVILMKCENKFSGIDASSIPEGARVSYRYIDNRPISGEAIKLSMAITNAPTHLFIRKYVGDIIKARKSVNTKTHICLKATNASGLDELEIRLITTKGITYAGKIKIVEGVARISVANLCKSKTALLPAPYPVFLQRETEPVVEEQFKLSDVEQVEISTPEIKTGEISFDLSGIWIE